MDGWGDTRGSTQLGEVLYDRWQFGFHVVCSGVASEDFKWEDWLIWLDLQNRKKSLVADRALSERVKREMLQKANDNHSQNQEREK